MTDQTPAPTPAPQPAAPAYAPAPAGATWNVLSIVSLVIGIVGFGWISLGAIITGHLALSQIKRTGEQGRGLALAGTILGYVGVAFSIIIGIVWILIFVAAASSGVYYNN